MSSAIDSTEAIIAAAVALPAAAAFGAGWLAWQSGKLLTDTVRSVNRQVAEKKRQMEDAARHRKMTALAAHRQLVDACSQVLSQLEDTNAVGDAVSLEEIEQLKQDLKSICEESVPDDAAQIESLTSFGYSKLGKIVRRQQKIASLVLSDSKSGLYQGLSVADLMEDLRIAVAAMDIKATTGMDVKAADPAVLERAKLNEAFERVTSRILTALESVSELTSKYGLTRSASAWYHSCFDGVDMLIEKLCRPTTTNEELKKGIRRLEKSYEQYEMMAPRLECDIPKMAALYEVYADASKALGEKAESFKSFQSPAEIEERLKYLQKQAEKAQECAEIYQKLGPAAYMCYAWDQELQALGYEVHTRKKIAEMASKMPERAKLGENKLPFYQWDEETMTQLYSIASECSLQLIVHDDGAVSMQTIANAEDDAVVAAQHSHCSQLKTLRERLRKNWFILYDFEETESADKVMTVAGWKASEDFAWKDDHQMITEQRSRGKTAEKAKQAQ